MTAPSSETDEAAPAESPYDRKARELEAVLRNMRPLKLAEGDAPRGIPYNFFIPAIVRQLILAGQRGASPKPNANSAKKLASLIGGSKELLEDWGFMALLPLEIRINLVEIAHFDTSAMKSGARAGAPQKRQAAAVAQTFGRHFYGLTAKQPSGFDEGLFSSYLAEIYDVLGIAADAINQAKQAARRLKNIPPNPMEFLSG